MYRNPMMRSIILFTMLVMCLGGYAAASSHLNADAPVTGGGKPDKGSISLSATPTTVYVGDEVKLTANVDVAQHKDGDNVVDCPTSSISASIDHGTKDSESTDTHLVYYWEAELPAGTPQGESDQVTITASVSGSCGSYDPDSDSVTITVKPPEITQFTSKPANFPKCQDTSVSLEDFNIYTQPSKYSEKNEDGSYKYITDVSWKDKDGNNDHTSYAGEHTVTAKIQGFAGSDKSTTYNVVKRGEWHPYKTESDFEFEAVSRGSPATFTSSQKKLLGAQDTLCGGTADVVVRVYDLPDAIRVYGIQGDPGQHISIAKKSVQKESISDQVGFAFKGLNVSVTHSWSRVDELDVGIDQGGGSDPAAYWIIVFQKARQLLLSHVEMEPMSDMVICNRTTANPTYALRELTSPQSTLCQ